MCYWAYSVILGFGGESTLSGITDEFTESWRRAQTSTSEEGRSRCAVEKPRSRQSIPRSRHPRGHKSYAESKPRSRSSVPRSRYPSQIKRSLQGENRGRGRVYRGRAMVRERKEEILQEHNRGRGSMDRGRAIIQEHIRGRGRSAAVAGEAVSKFSGFPSENYIFYYFPYLFVVR